MRVNGGWRVCFEWFEGWQLRRGIRVAARSKGLIICHRNYLTWMHLSLLKVQRSGLCQWYVADDPLCGVDMSFLAARRGSEGEEGRAT